MRFLASVQLTDLIFYMLQALVYSMKLFSRENKSLF